MRNITFSVEGADIEAARKRALQERTTLNEKVREWIRRYGNAEDREVIVQRAMEVIRYLQQQHFTIDRKYTREEMNER